MVWRVAVKGWSLDGEGEPSGCGVDFLGGAQNPEVSQAAFLPKKQTKRRKTDLNGQDVSGGAHEAVRCPSLNLVPEHRELASHVDGGHEDVRAIAEDGEEEGGSQPVTEKGRQQNRGRSPPLYRRKS